MSWENNQNKQTILNLITGILTMVTQMLVSFFLSPYIVSTLGEEANGFTQLANNFVSYATLLTVAFNSMAGRFVSVSYHQGRKNDVQKYYSSVVACNIGICVLLIPVSIYIVTKLEYVIQLGNTDAKDAKVLFLCVFLNFFVGLVLSIYNISLVVMNRIYVQNVLNLGRNILNAVLLLVLFSTLPAKMYYVSLTALVLSFIMLPILARYQHLILPELKFDRRTFDIHAVIEMLKSGIWNTVNQCGNMLMTGLDLLISNLFISPEAMGILSVAKVFPNAVISLATSLNGSFSPALIMNWAKGDSTRTLQQLRSSMKISSIIVSLPIITFCALGKYFYRLWMPTMDANELAILSFLSCMAFVPWAGPQALFNVFTATNKLRVNSLSFLVTGFLNLGIVYILLSTTDIGIYAVAGVSSTLTIIKNVGLIAPYTAHLLGLKWYEFYKDIAISVGCCGINFVVVLVVDCLLVIDSWTMLIVAAGVVCIVSIICEGFLVLSKEERIWAKEKIVRKVKRG